MREAREAGYDDAGQELGEGGVHAKSRGVSRKVSSGSVSLMLMS